MEKFQLSSSATLVNSPTRSRTSTHDSASTCPMYEPVSSTEEHLSRSTKIYSRTRKSALTSSLELPVVSTLSFATSPSSVEAFVTSFSTSATRCSNPSVSQQLFKTIGLSSPFSRVSRIRYSKTIQAKMDRLRLLICSSKSIISLSLVRPRSTRNFEPKGSETTHGRLSKILLHRSCPAVSSRHNVMSYRQAPSSHRWPPKFDYHQETPLSISSPPSRANLVSFLLPPPPIFPPPTNTLPSPNNA